MRNARAKDTTGSSMVETLIALALGAVVTTSTFNFFVAQDRVYSMEGQAEKVQRNARLAMDTMSKDIRMVGYQSQSADIDVAQTTSFTFQADTDNDAVTEKIQYGKNDANQLTRRVWTWSGSSWVSAAAAQAVADYISNLSFSYRDANGNVTAVLANIRVVRVTLTATSPKADPVSGNHRTASLSMDITPRNLGY